MTVKALMCDVFGTMVDWRTGVALAVSTTMAAKNIDLDPFDFADSWRAEYQPAMERIRDGNRSYVALDILHRENLDIVLDKFGLSAAFDDSARAALNTAWEKLPPWQDTVAALTALKADYLIAPCSNGSIALMARLARYAALPWHAILGAEIAQDYKPRPDVYLKSCAALQLAPGEVMMVAAHNNDLETARAWGLKTGFFPRPLEYGPAQRGDLEASADWDVVAEDAAQFAQIMCERAR